MKIWLHATWHIIPHNRIFNNPHFLLGYKQTFNNIQIHHSHQATNNENKQYLMLHSRHVVENMCNSTTNFVDISKHQTFTPSTT
jgi:hypothetical protein